MGERLLSNIKMNRLFEKEEGNSGLLKRKDIESKFKWNLTDIYSSDLEWENGFSELKSKTEKLGVFKGTLSE